MAQAGGEPLYETIDGLRLRYGVAKAMGPPRPPPHGIASSRYTWKDVLPALAAHHDVIAMDSPAYGDSPFPRPRAARRSLRSDGGG
jgi:pimeloyl-ACP methyl ester carboxylesterase